MNAHGKDGKTLTDITATVQESGTKPNFKKTAAELLRLCREFYQDPDNERAFREWMAGTEEKEA